MRYRRLGKTGLEVSILGFGGSPLGGVFGEVDADECVRTVHEALDAGINYFDVAPFYGLTRAESMLGLCLAGVPRERFLLSTKVGRYGQADFDFSAARVTRGVEESLERLGVETIDLLVCHDIEYGSLDQIVEETLPALRKIQETGKVRFLGISGLPLQVFRTVSARTELDFILSYCHYSLNDTSLESLLPMLRERGVGVINASALGMGLLTDRPLPDWHPAPLEMRAAASAALAYCREHGVDLAQIGLQFALDNPEIATTFVGITDRATLTRNLAALESPLDPEILRNVQEILSPIHNLTWPSGRPENTAGRSPGTNKGAA
jgi:L-galactose dehydrogenase